MRNFSVGAATLLSAAILLTACAPMRLEKAENAQNKMVGLSKEQLLALQHGAVVQLLLKRCLSLIWAKLLPAAIAGSRVRFGLSGLKIKWAYTALAEMQYC